MMPSIKRRHFLQGAGATLASIGLSQLDFFIQADRTAQVLAQSTGRKLALLVGINTYQDIYIRNLQGCVTDVEMQYYLLRYRYGFKKEDIRVLITDDKKYEVPTRQNILNAFEEHLIQQAKPGDIVVFHYSGHGGLMQDPYPIDPQSPSSGTLIPADCRLDDRNDIMGQTLFLLSSQLQTENFTMVLDSCHSGGGVRGNLVVRALRPSRSNEPIATPSNAELAYQAAQRQKLGWSIDKMQTLRKAGIAKGVAIGSAQKDQLAVDANFSGFDAGALTYLLTRYLWQIPGSESLDDTFNHLSLVTQELANTAGNPQVPIKEVAPHRPFETAPVYLTKPVRPSAEGVVRQIRSNGTIEFWLGGVSSRSLEGFTNGSLFLLVDDRGKELGELKQTARSGLIGYGTLTAGKVPPVGTLLREKLRVLPSDVLLKLGVDPNVGANQAELVQELQKLSNVQVLPIEQLAAGDFIVGALSKTSRNACQSCGVRIEQSNGSIGLFTVAAEPINNSFGPLDESPQETIARLRPQLKTLLARQYLSLILNGDSAQLRVDVNLKSRANGKMQVLSADGQRSRKDHAVLPPAKALSVIDANITNHEEHAIYMAAIAVGDDGSLQILHPADWDSPESAAIIQKGENKPVPIEVFGPASFFEVLIITSASPLRETLKGLQAIARARGLGRGVYIDFSANGSSRAPGEPEDSVVQFSQMLTYDVTRGLRAGARNANGAALQRGLDPKSSGIFSAILQVVD